MSSSAHSSSLSSSLSSTVVPSSTMSSITEGAKRVELLNSLKMKDKKEFIELVRVNVGADAIKGNYGLTSDRKYHGKYQERFHCTGCTDFNLVINMANEGLKILKSSVVDHGSEDKVNNCFMACDVGNGQRKDPVTEVEITSNNKRRIRAGKGCSSLDLNEQPVIKKLKEATKTGKRSLTMHQISTVATSLGMGKPTIDQVKKSMVGLLSEEEVEYSLQAYAKALKKKNGGVEYEFSTHPDGTLKYLVIAVSGAREIFAKSQQIVYIDCAHLKSVEGNLLNAEREYIKPVMVAMTSRSFNKNNHVLVR
jgi:hypothetical protein